MTSTQRAESTWARPLLGSAVGVTLAAVIVFLFTVVGVTQSARPGLLLVLPVVVAAVIGGRSGGLIVAAFATVGFILVVPPIGSLDISLTNGVIGIGVFVPVAFTVGTLVGGRLDALSRLQEQQRLLLRSVSHDLRTPLAVIRGASSELADQPGYDETARRRLLLLIERESERLDRLVGNLLSLSRIEAGAATPVPQSVDIAEVVEEAAAPLRRLFDDRELVVDLPDDLPFVDADYVQLGQVVSNLLENAVRHAPAGGKVSVGGSATDGSVELWFDDDGPGVPLDARDDIFEPFRSGANAGSTGFGLAICRSVVVAHGGSIKVGESHSGGARFTVTLPR